MKLEHFQKLAEKNELLSALCRNNKNEFSVTVNSKQEDKKFFLTYSFENRPHDSISREDWSWFGLK